ncbi:ketoacyl-synt-domain-containing protein [Xylariaceae sp. AK1471]|nr:ketoacyl-synt-domain-containing protein [Xylariaceae sp. AK1471]
MSPTAVEEEMVEQPALEPIAICGMSCRLPGGIDSASSFWSMLVDKRTGQTPKVPPSRFNIDAHYHQDRDRPGSFDVAGGYFLNGDPHDFDPSFFNVTPIEAQWLDPQQRRMLEVSYECLESAGLTLDQVAGSNTGVFVGSFTSDYQQSSTLEPDFRHSYAATGVDPGIISNRIGNVLNLNGPSFTINTACSSSIYALHNACNALRARDCEAAIVGGVNLILTVDQHMNTAKLGVLSPTSACHTFDASADGYGRAEGAGALYVRRLSDAIRDGNPIRGVIRATAVNSNGKIEGMGITHPSGKGQERVVRMAYEKAALDPRLTPYAELHGTGTPVGDPIEVRAISRALNDTRSENEPLLLGAVKPNIGHSEAASGIFAVMKAALMTEAAVIPGVALFSRINPEILERQWNVEVHANTAPWPVNSIRRTSVSSFGYGGTNGHVIVESVDNLLPFYKHGVRKANSEHNHSTGRPLLLCFSAHDKPTLSRNIAAIGAVAAEYYAADLAHTLNLHRTKFSHRGFTVVREGQEEIAFRAEELRMGVVPKKKGGVGFIFTGQGAQWAGMGRVAISEFPLFQETIERLDRVLSRLNPKPTFTLIDMLSSSEEAHGGKINDAYVAQPLCTAIQIALVDLFGAWDIIPSVSIGHSSGEVAAAYAAGLVSAPEAIIAAFVRGRAVREAAGAGSMLAVGLGAKDVAKWLPSDPQKVCIACENSPGSVTLSGDATAISELGRALKEEGIFAQELKTGRAYHSPHMAVVGEAYDAMLPQQLANLTDEDLSWRQPRSPMVSSVTGEVITGDAIAPTYWSTNLRECVLFDTAVRRMGSDQEFDDVTSFIEIGCHSALARAFKQINLANRTYIPSLVRDRNDADQLLAVAGSLFLADYPVDLQEVNLDLARESSSIRKPTTHSLLVDLPPYQWNYGKKYWAEPRVSVEKRNRSHCRHDLLGTRIAGLSNSCRAWRNILRHRDIPWLKDHNLGGEAVFPAAGYLSVAIEALRQVHETDNRPFDGVRIRDVDIKTALVVPESDGIEIVTCLHTTTDQEYTFTLESVISGLWTLHCEGKISAPFNSTITRENPIDETALTQRVSGKRWYEAFHRVGFNYTKTFQQLLEARSDKSLHHAAGNVVVTQKSGLMIDESRYMLHPSTIDACLQLIIISVHAGKHKEMAWGVVPTHIEKFSLVFPQGEPESTGHAVAWTDKSDGRHFKTHTCLKDSTGTLVMDIQGLTCTAYEAVLPPDLLVPSEAEPFSVTTWKPDIETISPDSVLRTDCLTDLVELVCHKQPIKSTLICGSPSSSVVRSTLEILPKSCSVTVGFSGEQQISPIDETLQDRITIKVSPEEWSTSLESSHFDLLIADYSDLENSNATLEVDALIPLLNTGGWLVGNRSCFSSLPRTAVASSQHFAYRQTDTGYTNGINGTVREISLLSLESSASDTMGLANALAECGSTVYEKQVTNFSANDQQCVVIDDRKGTTLLSLTDTDFSSLKTTLASGSPLLWLTQGVQEGRSAEGGMAEGFLRVIRSEQASVRVVLLDVDHNEPTKTVAQAIIDRLDTMSSSSSEGDSEFWLQQGVLRIPRLYPYVPQPAVIRDERWGKTLPTPSLPLPNVATISSVDAANNPRWLPLQPAGLSTNTQPFTSAVTLTDSIKNINANATPQTSQFALSNEGTYVLVGCLGGLGRSLTKWMMGHGARHFAFISRSGASKPEAARVIANIEKYPGTSTRVYRADASDEVAMQCIIYSLQAERSIRGVVHAAMVLKDGMFEQMSYTSFLAAITPKVRGALSLHKALGSAKLDFFVMTSSVSAVLGNMGQSNYSAANSFLDALARHRAAAGLAATSLALPMVLDVGVVAEDDAIEVSLMRKGLYGISEEEMLRGIEAAMTTRSHEPSSGSSRLAISTPAHLVMGMEVRELGRAIASIKADSTDPFWINNARFCHLRAAIEADAACGGSSSDSHVGAQEQGFATTLEAAQTKGPEAVVTVIAAHIMQRMSGILMIPVEDFEVDGPSLGSYGLDSMVGTEMRSWLFKEFGLDYSFQKLLSRTLTFRALAIVVAKKLGVFEASENE